MIIIMTSAYIKNQLGPELPFENFFFILKKNFEEKFFFFLAYNNPWPPMSVHKKFQPIWFNRLAGYGNMFTNVLFYYLESVQI